MRIIRGVVATALPALTLSSLLVVPMATATSASADVGGVTSPLISSAQASGSMKSWQKWGRRREVTPGNYCRAYVDAWFDGSKLMSSGAIQCEEDVAVIAMAFGVGSSAGRRSDSRACRSADMCYLSTRVPNPSGSQKFSAGTNGVVDGLVQIPPVNIEFTT